MPEHPHLPPTVRITFMGLYGVESPLPTHYIDDITQRREGYEATADFLDIFNHRLITQYYRIWRKYSYPATFEEGGRTKPRSICWGWPGSGLTVARTVSRPGLALSGAAAGDVAAGADCRRHGLAGAPAGTQHAGENLAPRQTPGAAEEAADHERQSARHPDKSPGDGQLCHRCEQPGTDASTTTDPAEVQGWLPGGELHTDLMALLHVYGSRLDVRLQLCVDRSLLPDATMSIKPKVGAVQLGRTAVMRPLNAANTAAHPKTITINLGRYERVQENIHRRETDEDGDYRW
jgi:type VI secretion system protein ImpH